MTREQTIRHRAGAALTRVGSSLAAAGFVSASALLPLAGLVWLVLAANGDTSRHPIASSVAVMALAGWAAALVGGLTLVAAGHRIDDLYAPRGRRR